MHVRGEGVPFIQVVATCMVMNDFFILFCVNSGPELLL